MSSETTSPATSDRAGGNRAATTARDATTQHAAPLPAAKSPAGTGATPLVAQLLALALVALGVVAVQHLLVQLGAVSGDSWLDTVVQAADGVAGDSPAVLAAAIVALVVGVLLLPIALKPRPRRTLALTADSGVHLRRKDLTRVVEAAIDGTDGVTDADVSVGRRKVKVVARSVATTDRDAALESTVREQVEKVCAAVDPSPRVDVTIRHEKS